MADTPVDLQKNSVATEKDFFTFSIPNLKIAQSYRIKFQWVKEDGTNNALWSPGFEFYTGTEGVPTAPTATVPATATSSIPVTLAEFPKNAQRVDVKIIGGEFGTGKVAYSFLSAGTTTIAANAGTYQVALYAVKPSGVVGDPTDVFNVTVSAVGETIQAPTTPNGFTSRAIIGGVEVTWAGTYAASSFTGFEAIKLYAGTAPTLIGGTYIDVGVLTGNNVKNTLVIPVDGTYVKYGQAVYIHAAAVNKSGTIGTIVANVTSQPSGPGKAGVIDLAAGTISVNNLEAGNISSTSYVRAGTASSARVEIASNDVTGTTVKGGLYIYNSAGTAILSAPLTGGLTINGGGTFTGALSGASGQFDGDLGASGGNFTVRSGIVSALAGNIGGWTINTTSLRSTAANNVNRIILNQNTPAIELINPAKGSIYIDPIDGIRDSNGNFSLTPDGTLNLKGTIKSGSTITGSEISLTGNPSTKIKMVASNYWIYGENDTFTYTELVDVYDPLTGETETVDTQKTVTTNRIRFTDQTWDGLPPTSAFYYGEAWMNSGSELGEATLWANWQGDYIGMGVRATPTEKTIWMRGSGSSWTNEHLRSDLVTDQPTYLQIDSAGNISRGRALFYTGASTATITGSSWLNVGQNGDLAFSTNN